MCQCPGKKLVSRVVVRCSEAPGSPRRQPKIAKEIAKWQRAHVCGVIAACETEGLTFRSKSRRPHFRVSSTIALVPICFLSRTPRFLALRTAGARCGASVSSPLSRIGLRCSPCQRDAVRLSVDVLPGELRRAHKEAYKGEPMMRCRYLPKAREW